MKKPVWLTFDLGVRGDYEGMYAFLDDHEARECGDSAAFMTFEFKADLAGELKAALEKAVNLDRRSRIYLVFPAAKGKYKGRFLVGKRKQAPWTGYGSAVGDEEDIGE